MNNEVVNLKVEGMSCNHCVNSVKTSVGELEGVRSVDVDLAKKEVTVEYDSSLVDIQRIKDTIENQGYDVNKEISSNK